MIQAFRIVKKKYAKTAFDGEGARIYGGRWNHEGFSMIYTSSSLALAALELFVNLEGPPNRDLVSIAIDIPAELIIAEVDNLPKEWNVYPATAASKNVGSTWIEKKASAVLKVPSVIISTEFNYLINPDHPDFKKISLKAPAYFSFDQRMWH